MKVKFFLIVLVLIGTLTACQTKDDAGIIEVPVYSGDYGRPPLGGVGDPSYVQGPDGTQYDLNCLQSNIGNIQQYGPSALSQCSVGFGSQQNYNYYNGTNSYGLDSWIQSYFGTNSYNGYNNSYWSNYNNWVPYFQNYPNYSNYYNGDCYDDYYYDDYYYDEPYIDVYYY